MTVSFVLMFLGGAFIWFGVTSAGQTASPALTYGLMAVGFIMFGFGIMGRRWSGE